MKNSKKGRMLEGVLVGAALGVATGMLLESASGKKLRGNAKQKSAEFYAYLSPRIKKMKKIGEREYKALAKSALKSYSKAKRLSPIEEKAIIAEAKKYWKHLKRHLV